MASSEHLLRALIPHAVINHDVTAHLGRKGWVEPVLDPPTGGDAAPCSMAARRARAGVSVAPWAESRDGFTRARLAALESSLPDADNCRALSAMAALRTALTEGLDDAAAVSVASDGTPGTSPEVLEAAVAWLRASPVRCALDLPCLSIDRVLFDEAPSAEVLAALAPCVTQACFNDDLEAEDALNVLQHLPRATELILASTFIVPFMEALDRRVAENDDGAVMVAKRLRQLSFCGELARVQNPRSEEPLFPNVTTMKLGWEIESPDVWRWLSLHQAIEDLDVNYFCWCGFGDSRDVCDNSPAAAAERESAIVAAFAQIGPTLRKLSISVQNYVEMTTPRILASIWKHCVNVRELTLHRVDAGPGFFRDLAGLRYLRSLTLEFIKGSGDDGEAADLVALPAALTQLEELTQSYWAFDVPAAFVEALAALPQLTTWDAPWVRFSEHIATTASDVRSSPTPFRTLRVAKLLGSALPVVALTPNLRLLVPSDLDGCHDLQGIAFTSPYVRVDIPPTTAPTTLFAARALHGSGVFSLCGVLAPDAAFEAAGSPELAAFPPTLRHAEFASPPNFRPDPVVCALELTQLLTAARGSNLETLTLLHPPDVDVGATFGPGGFHWLRSLTVLGASQTWVDASPVLRAVCPDVVVERPDIVDDDSRRSSKYAEDFFTS